MSTVICPPLGVHERDCHMCHGKQRPKVTEQASLYIYSMEKYTHKKYKCFSVQFGNLGWGFSERLGAAWQVWRSGAAWPYAVSVVRCTAWRHTNAKHDDTFSQHGQENIAWWQTKTKSKETFSQLGDRINPTSNFLTSQHVHQHKHLDDPQTTAHASHLPCRRDLTRLAMLTDWYVKHQGLCSVPLPAWHPHAHGTVPQGN